jgi:heat shock protein HslJ
VNKEGTTVMFRYNLWAIVISVLVVGLIAATAPQAAASDRNPNDFPLVGTDWVLVSIGDTEISPGEDVTAQFDGERMAGSAGCNGYFAAYKTDAESLQMGPAGATMMMCPGPAMELEQSFLSALASANSYRIVGDRLEIGFDGSSLIFQAE